MPNNKEIEDIIKHLTSDERKIALNILLQEYLGELNSLQEISFEREDMIMVRIINRRIKAIDELLNGMNMRREGLKMAD